MTDPLSLIALGAAVGGASGKLVENAWALGQKWIANYFRDHRDKALQQAEQNAARFLVDLAQRVKELEERIKLQEGSSERLAEVLSDPDVAAVLQSSLLASARTSSEEKHDILARAVAERIAAAPDSLQALAANIAVEAVPRLAAHHLQILALAAVVYTVRSLGLPLSEEPPTGVEHWDSSPEEQQALLEYIPWLENALNGTFPKELVVDADYVHLASTNCLVIERGMERDLKAVLQPYRNRVMSMAAAGQYPYRISEWFSRSVVARRLIAVWEEGLQRITLTPAGLLLGVSAFDHVSGGNTVIDWASHYVTSSAEPADLQIWDGRQIREKFLRALDSEVRDRIERGVSPWYDLDKGRE